MEQNNDSNAVLTRIMNKLTPEELDILAKFFNRETETNTKCRKSFSPKEDERLKMLVAKYGTDNWSAIEKEMPGRNVRQCRERYKHYLSPEISQQPWTPAEDELLLAKVNEIGSRWVTISKFFNNRTDINVKNRWVVLMRRNASVGSEHPHNHKENSPTTQNQENTAPQQTELSTLTINSTAPLEFNYIPPLKLTNPKPTNSSSSNIYPSISPIVNIISS